MMRTLERLLTEHIVDIILTVLRSSDLTVTFYGGREGENRE